MTLIIYYIPVIHGCVSSHFVFLFWWMRVLCSVWRLFLRGARFSLQLEKRKKCFFSFPFSEQMFLILIRDEGCPSLPWHSILARTTTLQTWLGCRKLLSNLEIWWLWTFGTVRGSSTFEQCSTSTGRSPPRLCTPTHTFFVFSFIMKMYIVERSGSAQM